MPSAGEDVSNRNSHLLLTGMKNRRAIMEDSSSQFIKKKKIAYSVEKKNCDFCRGFHQVKNLSLHPWNLALTMWCDLPNSVWNQWMWKSRGLMCACGLRITFSTTRNSIKTKRGSPGWSNKGGGILEQTQAIPVQKPWVSQPVTRPIQQKLL